MTTAGVDKEVFDLGLPVSADLCSSLVREVSDMEIKAALDGIGDDKAPGPDGYTSKFFKVTWDSVGPSVCAAVREFFTKKRLLKQLNVTAIALIPKEKHEPQVCDFRPISCCNIIYKIISKLLASRLKLVLDSVVDKAQSAFIPGRNLVDNIHLIQELLRGYSRKRTSPRCTIKIDLRKAFDTVEWGFVGAVLMGLGIPHTFIDWVMECISSPSYSLIVNGSLHGFFKGKRGLRQGDPLSPCLFVLCLEYFSRLVRKRTTDSDFNFHPKCSSLNITHLAFADDLMLLARGDPRSIEILMSCLKDFGAVSGLMLNVQKSNIYTAGISNGDLGVILDATGLGRGSMPFRYLGIPLAAEKLKIVNYEPLIDRITELIKSWNGPSLSYAGRAELIKSVLQGVYCFWASIFNIPATVRNIITCLCRDFLWGRRCASVAWDKVCHPKNEGGLGFRDFKTWNDAFLAKLLWNVNAKKDTLWIRWVNQVYLRGISVWDWKVHNRDSALLKGMGIVRNKILESGGSKMEADRLLNSWFVELEGGVSTVYNHFRVRDGIIPWVKVVWCPLSSPKHSFVLWLAMKGRLYTKDRLKLDGIDSTCVFCSDATETCDHLFFNCRFSNEIWETIRRWIGLGRRCRTVTSTVLSLSRVAKGNSWKAMLKKIACAATVYHIWTARNKLVFEGKVPIASSTVSSIQLDVYRPLFQHFPILLPPVRGV